MTYYNTTQQKDEILKNFKAKATDQNGIILSWFKKNKDKEVSTDDIWVNLFDTSVVPQTSIRRSITNLTDKGFLEKLGKEKKVIGMLGRPVHVWRLNR
tara:strand:- start:892 stop:1185 length:294 start_codon:yes stop_codon:yes gene_type:complete